MAPFQFGILMVPYQTLDVAGPLDILASSSKAQISLLEASGFSIPPGTIEKAVDITFHHINETMSPVTLTSGFSVLPTTTCDTCPPLDFLLVGGPDPVAYQFSERFGTFVKDHVQVGKGLFTTCTGGLSISSSGVLDGRSATTNHMALPMARIMSPKVNWVQKQWVVDGNIWTAGGACAGMDMMAHWLIENYGIEIAKFGFAGLDFEPRGLDGEKIVLKESMAASSI